MKTHASELERSYFQLKDFLGKDRAGQGIIG